MLPSHNQSTTFRFVAGTRQPAAEVRLLKRSAGSTIRRDVNSPPAAAVGKAGAPTPDLEILRVFAPWRLCVKISD